VTRYFITGGCGFIGSHVAHRLLEEHPDAEVVVFDNLLSGQESYLSDVRDDERLTVVIADLKDFDAVLAAAKGCDHAYHLAANPDIAKAVTEPSVDFWEGTYLTNNLLEACRINGVKRVTYASGSGVYGDRGSIPVGEDSGPMHPVSTYGASKLGCEAMLSAYCHMFDMHAVAFRFANVVGPRQTHGVTYDFVRRLLDDPSELQILGDGKQSKSYIHVNDVIDAMFLVEERAWIGFEVYNVGTEDYVTVKEIADLVVEHLQLENVRYSFTGGSRGWKGDVPVVRFHTERIRALGWANRLTSKEALSDSILSNISEASREAATR
jgi:UDP-glucose 4-epimerase